MISFLTGRRTKWLVLLFWVVVGGVAGSTAAKLPGIEKNNPAAFLPASAPSTKVQALLPRFAGARDQLATVVFHRPGGLGSTDRATIAADRQRVDASPARAVAQQPALPTATSTDGTTAYFSVPMSSSADINQLTTAVDHLRSIVGEGAGGLDVKVTGQAASLVDSVKVFKGIDGTLLLAAGLLVAVLLLLIYRSPFLWLLPLVAVGFAYQAAQGAVYASALHGLVVNGQSAGILTVLVFGVGTDYALLIVARYREELRRHQDHHEAMAAALRRSGPAIVASGSTVTLSLLCLLASSLNSDKGLGPVCAIGVVVAVVAMLSLLPALLLALGRRIFWPFVPRYSAAEAAGASAPASRLWAALGRLVARRDRTVWIGTAAVLAVCSLGLFHLDTNLTNAQSFTSSVDSVEGQAILSQDFPSGITAPLFVVVPATDARQAAAAAARTPGIAQVLPAQTSGDLALVPAIATAADSTPRADATVVALRHTLTSSVGPTALVGGASAIDYDVRQATVRDEKVVIPMVLAVVLVILALLLRALLGPFLLVLTVILSFLAALGVASVANTALFGFAATSPSLPLFGFIFLVALGCDYNIFLMARIREEAHRIGARSGVLRGLEATGGVITSAGLILAGTFAVLGVLPLVVLAEIGFVVAFGVLLDTFVVRTLLVPALAHDLGDAWWRPGSLAGRARRGVRSEPPDQAAAGIGEPGPA